jgi:hypothetical protein
MVDPELATVITQHENRNKIAHSYFIKSQWRTYFKALIEFRCKLLDYILIAGVNGIHIHDQ